MIEPLALSEAEALARLRLIRTAGLGPVHYERFLRHYGSGLKTIEQWNDLARRQSSQGRLGPLCCENEAEAEWEKAHNYGARPLFMAKPIILSFCRCLIDHRHFYGLWGPWYHKSIP